MKWKRTIFSMQIQLTCNFRCLIFVFKFIRRFLFPVLSFTRIRSHSVWRTIDVFFFQLFPLIAYPPEWTTTMKNQNLRRKKTGIYFYRNTNKNARGNLHAERKCERNEQKRRNMKNVNGIFATISEQKRPTLCRIYIWLALVCFRGLLQTRTVL